LSIVDDLLSRYVLLLFMGNGCTPCHIKSGTVLGYLTLINAHYVEMGICPPFVAKSKSKTARLFADTKKFELKPDHREPISNKAFNKMQEFASLGSFMGFKSLAWDIAALGHYGGSCQQEYAMDHKNKVKYFNTPKGQVVCAFTVENILFRDRDQMIVHYPLLLSELIKTVGMRYMVQKNRRKGQVIWFSRDLANPSLCLVVRALSLVRGAVILGQSPSDPICMYRDTTNDTVYLTGAAITKYFWHVMKLVYPDINAATLASISSHSL
jgi:hypothetical protein